MLIHMDQLVCLSSEWKWSNEFKPWADRSFDWVTDRYGWICYCLFFCFRTAFMDIPFWFDYLSL